MSRRGSWRSFDRFGVKALHLRTFASAPTVGRRQRPRAHRPGPVLAAVVNLTESVRSSLGVDSRQLGPTSDGAVAAAASTHFRHCERGRNIACVSSRGYTFAVGRTGCFGVWSRICAALLLCCLLVDLAMLGRCCLGHGSSGSDPLAVSASADSPTLSLENSPDDCFCCARSTVQVRYELTSAGPVAAASAEFAPPLTISHLPSLYHPPHARA